MILHGSVGPNVMSDGVSPPGGFRQGRLGEMIMSELHGRYYTQVRRGNVFMARAIVTAPVAFSTAAGTGGPLLWNGSSTVNAAILAIGYGNSVANTTTAVALGLTGNTGQTVAPGTTTAIDSVINTYIGGATPNCTTYQKGTVTVAGSLFTPFADLMTGAITTRPGNVNWVDLGGLWVVPPNAWVSLACSAASTAAVFNVAMIWEEVPV